MSTPALRPNRRFASPRARRILKARGLDAAQVLGSGPNGRIIETDVLKLRIASPETAKAESSRAVFILRAEVDATQILQIEARSKIARHEFLQRALDKAASTHGLEKGNIMLAQSANARADEFSPTLPDGAFGVLGAGRIIERPFVREGVLVVRATLKLFLQGDETQREMLEAIFDFIVEILEDPMLLIFL